MHAYDAALDEGATQDAVASAVAALGVVSNHDIPAGEQQLREHVWVLADQRGNVRYVYDHFVDVPSLRAESPRFGEPGEIIFELSQHITVFEVDALVSMFRESDEVTRQAYALRALASVTPRYRADVFDSMCDALESPIPEMRGLAMKCMARWPYFGFAKRLRDRASRETDATLQKEAVRLAEDIAAHGRRGTLV